MLEPGRMSVTLNIADLEVKNVSLSVLNALTSSIGDESSSELMRGMTFITLRKVDVDMALKSEP